MDQRDRAAVPKQLDPPTLKPTPFYLYSLPSLSPPPTPSLSIKSYSQPVSSTIPQRAATSSSHNKHEKEKRLQREERLLLFPDEGMVFLFRSVSSLTGGGSPEGKTLQASLHRRTPLISEQAYGNLSTETQYEISAHFD